MRGSDLAFSPSLKASFGLKVGAGYAGAIVVASVVAFSSTRALRSITDGAGRRELLHSRDLIEIGELRTVAERMGGRLRSYLLIGDEGDLLAAREAHAAFVRIVATLRESGSGAESPLLAEVSQAEQRYQDAIAGLVQLRQIGADRPMLVRAYLERATGPQADLTRAIDAYVVVEGQRLSVLRRDAEREAARAEQLVSTIGVVALLLTLADGLLIAIAIARAYRQTQALVESERRLAKAERCQRFLADAGDVLASSLDYDTTLRKVAAVAVPAFADWCIVEVGKKHLRHVALGDASPHGKALAEALGGQALDELQHLIGAQRVFESRRPECCADVRELLRCAGVEDGLADALGMRSCMCLPIRGRERVLGVLTLVGGASRQPYGKEDLSVAEELAAKAALAIENAHLYRQAQEAIRVREEFLTVASHELRTPLTSLKLQVESLLRARVEDGAGSSANPACVKIDGVARQVERLTEVVGTVLDVSDMDRGAIRLERSTTELGALVSEVAHRLREQAERAGCHIGVHARAPVVGQWDKIRVQQVVTHLLSNAIKYGPGESIDVELSATGTAARLVVRDRGIGIPEDSLERVFGRFERAVPVRYGGLGLGLYVVRQIVEAHGGTVHAQSNPGKGATFIVTLPLGAHDAALAVSTRGPSPFANMPDSTWARAPRGVCEAQVSTEGHRASHPMRVE